MSTKWALVISFSLFVLIVGSSLLLSSNILEREAFVDNNMVLDSNAFESFLIRSDEGTLPSGKMVPYGQRLFEMDKDGNVSEIFIPGGMDAFNGQYSPDGTRILLSFCESADRRLCAIYLYDRESEETVNITEIDPDGDYVDPIWITDTTIAYLRNTAEGSEPQHFVPFVAGIDNATQGERVGGEIKGSCFYTDANDSGDFAVGCVDDSTNETSIALYDKSLMGLEMYFTDDLVTDIEVANDSSVYAIAAAEENDHVPAILNLERGTYSEPGARSIAFIESDIFAFTDSPTQNLLTVFDSGRKEIIESPERIILDVK